jgi:putative ABC transport system permease protein
MRSIGGHGGLALRALAWSIILSVAVAVGAAAIQFTAEGGPAAAAPTGPEPSLTVLDAQALLDGVSDIERVSPVVFGSVQVKSTGTPIACPAYGVGVTYLPMRGITLDSGRLFTNADIDTLARVVLLGSATAEKLFGKDVPIGETLKLNGVNFTVIGVVKAPAAVAAAADDLLFIPYTTAMKQLFRQDYLNEIDLQVREGADLRPVQAAARLLLRKRHRLEPGAPDDFTIRAPADAPAAKDKPAKAPQLLIIQPTPRRKPSEKGPAGVSLGREEPSRMRVNS